MLGCSRPAPAAARAPRQRGAPRLRRDSALYCRPRLGNPISTNLGTFSVPTRALAAAAAADMRRGRPRAAAVGARAGVGGRVPCTGLGRGVAAPGRRATGVAARPHPAAAHDRACRGARRSRRAAARGASRRDGCRVMWGLARRCGKRRGGQHLRHRLFLAARIMVPRIGTVLELAAWAARLLCCPADGGGCGSYSG